MSYIFPEFSKPFGFSIYLDGKYRPVNSAYAEKFHTIIKSDLGITVIGSRVTCTQDGSLMMNLYSKTDEVTSALWGDNHFLSCIDKYPQIVKDVIICLQKAVSEFGIRVADDKILKENFDAVADCAGRHIQVKSRCGYAELTRSGLEYYKNSDAPVFSVDSGILKRFETTLGTGESFVRAMNYLNYTDFDGKNILIFGGGKVGCGTAYFSAKAGARVFIADMAKIPPPPQVGLIDAGDHEAVFRAIKDAW